MNENSIAVLQDQYALIKDARTVLLGYCKTIAPTDLYVNHATFGRGSIHSLLAHILNTYHFWIGEQLLGKTNTYISYTDKTPLNTLLAAFSKVDALMESFFEYLHTQPPKVFTYEITGQKGTTTNLQVFTHVITHESHHKGQLLSLSRLLGYTPVDTDILR